MAFSDLFKNHKAESKEDEQADVRKWVENNDRKAHSCQDCVYKVGKFDNEKICSLSNRPIVQIIDGIAYPIRWDRCEAYKMVKYCDNCGNQKSSTLMIADTPLIIDFCPYKHRECENNEMWISRMDAINKIVLEQPKTQSERNMEKIHKEVAKSKVKPVEKVEIPVVDKDEEVPMSANPTIATMVNEISTTMKEEEERSEPEPEPVEVVKAKEIKEEQELHEEHIAPILDNITNGNLDEIKSGEVEIEPEIEEGPEQLVATPEPIGVKEEPTAPPEDVAEQKDDKKYVFSYNDYERLPGESRKEFKRRVRQELGIKD